MSITGKRITAPIGYAEVAGLIGDAAAASDTGSLCLSRRINKWAKFKPVNRPELYLDSDNPDDKEKFRGTLSDITNGIAYGLRARPATLTDIASLHDSTYEYVGRPAGGEASPYRVADFKNYKHDAQPDLLGTPALPLDTPNPANYSLAVSVYAGAADEYEVSVIGLLSAFGDASDKDLLDYYPAVLVTVGSKGSKGYMHGLYSGEETSCHPIRYNGAVRTDFFVPTSGCPALKNLSSETQAWVTFFLTEAIKPTTSTSQTGINEWVKVDTGTLWPGMRSYSLPGASGLQYAFAPAASAGSVAISSISASTTAVTVRPIVDESLFGSSPSSGATVSFSVKLRPTGGNAATKTATATYTSYSGAGAVLNPVVEFSWEELGMVVQKGQLVAVSAQAIYNGVTTDTKNVTVEVG